MKVIWPAFSPVVSSDAHAALSGGMMRCTGVAGVQRMAKIVKLSLFKFAFRHIWPLI
jgi:hypothetical protein